jgi:hypothetical protein
MKTKTLIILLQLYVVRIGFSQGFVNLNFEAANLSGYSHGIVPDTNAFPGWTVLAPYIVYNDFSLSGGSISIMDSNTPYAGMPIQGKYSALFWGANSYSISLGQTGQVPAWAQTITFWGDDQGFQITFNGQLLNFSTLSTAASYTVYGANISAFVGQTGQLLITAPPTTVGTIDNIRFSATAIPEPRVLALEALGILLLGCRRWKS